MSAQHSALRLTRDVGTMKAGEVNYMVGIVEDARNPRLIIAVRILAGGVLVPRDAMEWC